jgi:hypothetical protein
MNSASDLDDPELLRIEIETLWGTDARGRIDGPDLVIASCSAGLGVGIGGGVPDDLANTLAMAVAEARPAGDLSEPPGVVEQCRRLLEGGLGRVELKASSGPSYAIDRPVVFRSEIPLVRSDATDVTSLAGANPGNWETDEWQQLLAGLLGPWVMATTGGNVVSICHTPVSRAGGAEAGVWTRPDSRGRGYAAAVTAEWASLMWPTGRLLFYSTSRTNASSQRVAARLGLRPIGWLWQLARRDPQG